MAQQRGMKRAAKVLKRQQKKAQVTHAYNLKHMHGEAGHEGHDHEGHDHEGHDHGKKKSK